MVSVTNEDTLLEDYTSIFWLNKELSKEQPIQNYPKTSKTEQIGKKWYSGMSVNYFDPSKSSVIHILGSNTSILITSRKTIAPDKEHPEGHSDWNVGIYRSDAQFIHDELEQKLGNCCKVRSDFITLTETYRSLLEVSNKTIYNKSISDLFVEIYKLNEIASNMEVRLTTHSQDDQLALSATLKLTNLGFQYINRVKVLNL